MILLDENIAESQVWLLRGWRIRVRQIGEDVAHKGIKDDAIIPLLHQLGNVTFVTRDLGFFRRQLIHRTYCLVCLDVQPNEAASFTRRFLRHKHFATQRRRSGSIVRVGHSGIHRIALRGPDEVLTWEARAL